MLKRCLVGWKFRTHMYLERYGLYQIQGKKASLSTVNVKDWAILNMGHLRNKQNIVHDQAQITVPHYHPQTTWAKCVPISTNTEIFIYICFVMIFEK